MDNVCVCVCGFVGLAVEHGGPKFSTPCIFVPCDVRLLVTIGVHNGKTVVARGPRSKTPDCEVGLRRHRTLCVHSLKYVRSSQRR